VLSPKVRVFMDFLIESVGTRLARTIGSQ